ncbi:hypothetical protein NQ318_023049 [Aromia moschata]|uniref:Ribosomal protein L7Ae/L30e/S12e/Gadd45 domain-containing protein n=1 Tax=Aromia moschata TaxID=1265417 RepID=A0AAV8XYL3_9CUCU|nr:hypothetical protein NQ318_023049 [Aromia moschata]
MVQHVIDQAVLYSIPVIIFNGLRKLLKEICGTGSVVLGISKDSNLNLITEAVAQCFEKCPPPVNHINYNRSVDSEVEIINVDKNFEPEKVENKIHEDEIRQTVYLKREDKSKRVFIPVYKEKVSRNDKMEEQVSKDVNTKKPSYKSLIVKRLRSDPKRNKKKIDTLKRKRKSQPVLLF